MALKNTWTAGETFAASDQNNVATEILGINASGVYASLPTVGHPGRVYDCTDNGNTYRDNGTTWDLAKLGGLGVAGVEPPSAGWSTTTLGSSTFAADKGGRLLTMPSASGNNLRIEYRTLSPTINYTATAIIDPLQIPTTSSNGGLALRNSSSGSLVTFFWGLDSGSGGWLLELWQWTSAGAAGGAPTPTYKQLVMNSPPRGYRFRDDGTNRNAEYTYNGIDWTPYVSIGRTDFITPDQVGWGGNNNTGITALCRLRSFAVTTP
jgi:hypothetical protein